MIKRTCDLIAAMIGLLFSWPLWLVAAVLIKLDSPGPVFFKQIRVGRAFRPFWIYKFRTMVTTGALQGSLVTSAGDDRVTRIGQILRRYKIDELPQLLNIFKGEMSVVGPRPEVPHYVESYRDEFAAILKVRPGLTDLASLKYIDESTHLKRAVEPEREYREVILPEKMRLAQLYVKHASLLLDLAIIVQTLVALFRLPLVVFDLPGVEVSTRARSSQVGAKLAAMILKWRRPLIVVLDIGLISSADYLAFWLRFDGAIPPFEWGLFVQLLPWLVAVRSTVFVVFRLNEGLWRYTSLWDLQNIIIGVLTSTLLFYGLVHWGMGLREYPRSIFIIDTILLIGFMTAVRLPRRIVRETVIFRPKKRVLIIGAGDTGERIVREMKMNGAAGYYPIGFIDDRMQLLSKTIHGVRVLGARKDLGRILLSERPDEVVLALPNVQPEVLRQLISTIGPTKVGIKMLPGRYDLLSDRSAMSQIRSVAVEDLLPRAPVSLQSYTTRQMVTGQRILITGAGGSIGSELSRQIVALNPEALILYERHENSLYTIAKELDDRGFSPLVHSIIGDVTDRRQFKETLNRHRPSIIFHAAAHKHVPLVELNPLEALKNNCIGTQIAAETADRCHVERFVLISTDKAVNPSSVMGASKRAAELIVQDLARCSDTRFLIVRFGNVLGSNGSVLLRFQEQIQAGGPVTVTHPAMRRYFMLISEAVQLVLRAASLGEQGAIYVLDMGEQIKVLDLAKNLIRLSGFVPGREIPIRFIGLRPGEKLSEELIGAGEAAEMSALEKILRIRRVETVGLAQVSGKVTALEAAAYLNNVLKAVERLRELVPEFQPPDPTDIPISAITEGMADHALNLPGTYRPQSS